MSELKHYGVVGMRWGRRKGVQNLKDNLNQKAQTAKEKLSAAKERLNIASGKVAMSIIQKCDAYSDRMDAEAASRMAKQKALSNPMVNAAYNNSVQEHAVNEQNRLFMEEVMRQQQRQMQYGNY